AGVWAAGVVAALGQQGQGGGPAAERAEDRVVEVEEPGPAGRDEELGVVGVLARVGHGELALAGEGDLLDELVDERRPGQPRVAADGPGDPASLHDEVVGPWEVVGDPREDLVRERREGRTRAG